MRLAQSGRWRRFTFTTDAGQCTVTVSARDSILTADRELGRWWAGKPIRDLLDHARGQRWTWTVEDDDRR